ncbi:hypothetical protein J1N35_015181 [Gossypium stocksii]|uniref:Reverse transcriptase n=1 Tax=Gossypium stocksii TaxID=47602 RepID=A0A9D3VVE9_9ROSI|nr:hypothetical protein J1N35_015181 [Gossypium stocksii]
MYGFEKRGGIPRDERKIEKFRNVLENCQLVDVGFFGNWFTWKRGNLPETNIRECLNRGVANDMWMNLCPEVTIQHLTHSFSDHCPLLITTKRVEKRVFVKDIKFEAWWIMEESFNEKAKNPWGASSGDLLQKLANLKGGLRQWAEQIQHDRKRRKNFLTNRLADLEGADRDDLNMVELIDAKIQLNFEIEKDECYWEQRA